MENKHHPTTAFCDDIINLRKQVARVQRPDKRLRRSNGEGEANFCSNATRVAACEYPRKQHGKFYEQKIKFQVVSFAIDTTSNRERQKKIEELKELLFGLETAKPTEEAKFEEDLYKCETRLDDLEVRVKKLINSINVSLSVTAVEKNKYENGTFAQTKIPPIILPTFSGKYEACF
ncbi:hypothetical protein TNCV_2265711 [Trichonephila clavipes]|nr:hypothetical protein TNCV_2265711 [Trichonephila clavipes]